jgi:hypothetical protein
MSNEPYVSSGFTEYVISSIEAKTGLSSHAISVDFDAGDEIEIQVRLYYRIETPPFYELTTLSFDSLTAFEKYLNGEEL